MIPSLRFCVFPCIHFAIFAHIYADMFLQLLLYAYLNLYAMGIYVKSIPKNEIHEMNEIK